MRAKEDAGVRPSSSRSVIPGAAFALVAGAVLGGLVAFAFPPADEPLFESRLAWVGEAPPASDLPTARGEEVQLQREGDGTVLLVRAPRAERARELAAVLAVRRTTRLRGITEARDALTARWGAAHAPIAPTWALMHARMRDAGADSAEGCASWLTAAAQWRRQVVQSVPQPWATPDDATLPVPPDAVFDRMRDVALAVDRRDVPTLAAALVAESAAEDEWFAAGAPSGDASLRRRAATWRAWQGARADSLEAMASRLAAALPPVLATQVPVDAATLLPALALRAPRPYDALLTSLTPAWTPVASALVPAWSRWVGIGALAGALAMLLLAWLVRGIAARLAAPRERVRHRASSSLSPLRDPGVRTAWLHVVAGPSPAAVARGVVELCAHALARGERVLVVDGGAKLRLHERFGREARWGLMECLLADMPVTGLMQYGGRPGLYLLAHGNTARSEGWAAVGHRLDDARPHFGRIVLAVDEAVPRPAGDALAGRALEGWWAAATPRLPGAAVALTERLGIAFSGMDLSLVPQASLEVLASRTQALALVVPPPPLEPVPAPAEMERETAPPEPAGPAVLDCDLQMRQRLRFLAWMRRVQSERRETEAVQG
jgi:hypothetical protein